MVEESAVNAGEKDTPAHGAENGDVFASIGKQVLGLDARKDEDGIEDEERFRVVDELESMCMECEGSGTTRLLLTKIPYFREVIIMSFSCDECGNRNNEIQPAGKIQEHGARIIFRATHADDLERQVVKSDSASIKIHEIDLEVPAGRGRLTDIEGVLSETMTGLQAGQGARAVIDADTHAKIAVIVARLAEMIAGTAFPFTISVDDPAGNSTLEPSPKDTSIKGKYVAEHYARTSEQNSDLGLRSNDQQTDSLSATEANPKAGEDALEGVEILEGHPYEIPIECPGCGKAAVVVLQMVNIPHFKQVVLSSTRCDYCNYRASDVKTGGEIPSQGRRTFLRITGPSDMRRDILKGEHCLLKIEKCGVEVQPGSMGGRFTTVEGLLTQIRDDLRASVFDTSDAEEIAASDSMPADKRRTWTEFFQQLERAIKAEFEYTLIMQDPIGGSYCQHVGVEEEDKNLWHEDYERSAEEEDDLGLADMRTHRNEDGEYVKEPNSLTDSDRIASDLTSMRLASKDGKSS